MDQQKKTVSTVLGLATLLLAGTSSTYAQVVTVDPGPLGNAGSTLVLPFSDLNGQSFTGQTLDLDFVFDAMKHVELPNSVPLLETTLRLSVDVFDPVSGGTPSGFLSDENGDPILTGVPSGSFPSINEVRWEVDYLNTPTQLMFHDVHFSAPMPGQTLTVTGAALELRTFGSGDMIIGEWVPEPSSLFLLGIGGLALSLCRRS